MNPRTPQVLLLALVTALVVPATASAHEEESPGTAVVQYFAQKEGALVLSDLPPPASAPEVWVQEGLFSPRTGLVIEIPLENVRGTDAVAEDEGVAGWVEVSFKAVSSSTVPNFFYSPYGSLKWTLVEGARSAGLLMDCRYNDPYYCERDGKAPMYVGHFPGHGPDAKPHTHGDGTDAAEPLWSGDFQWMLRYTVSPCSVYSCPVTVSSYRYQFSVLTDGSTFVQYASSAIGSAPQPEPEPEADAPEDPDNSTQGNGTEPGDPGDPGGNSTDPDNGTSSGNGSANGSAGAPGFGPRLYAAQPRGSAPGLPVAGLALAVAGGAFVAARRRAS